MALPGVDLDAVQGEVDRQCDALPRGSTAREALSHSCIVRVDSTVQGVAWLPWEISVAPCQCASCRANQIGSGSLNSRLVARSRQLKCK